MTLPDWMKTRTYSRPSPDLAPATRLSLLCFGLLFGVISCFVAKDIYMSISEPVIWGKVTGNSFETKTSSTKDSQGRRKTSSTCYITTSFEIETRGEYQIESRRHFGECEGETPPQNREFGKSLAVRKSTFGDGYVYAGISLLSCTLFVFFAAGAVFALLMAFDILKRR